MKSGRFARALHDPGRASDDDSPGFGHAVLPQDGGALFRQLVPKAERDRHGVQRFPERPERHVHGNAEARNPSIRDRDRDIVPTAKFHGGIPKLFLAQCDPAARPCHVSGGIDARLGSHDPT
jgi:hypothetical protein